MYSGSTTGFTHETAGQVVSGPKCVCGPDTAGDDDVAGLHAVVCQDFGVLDGVEVVQPAVTPKC